MSLGDFSGKSFKQMVYIHALVHSVKISTDIIAGLLEVPLELIENVYAGKDLLDERTSLKLLKLIAIYSKPPQTC